MKDHTIGGDETIAGGEGSLLANRYRIVRQLGQGGMGSVWLVEDTQLDDKPFAVKMLPSILVSNKRAYRQLKDEAIMAMRLAHPNIVQIRAFEENNGNPFLVMDYVDGQTLDDYLAEHTGTTGVSPVAGGISEAEVQRILRPIAAALDYAHGEGVVHRDVKPANVMIRTDGHPFILDFGIAREIQETMTRVTGKLSSGTLLYMSPEQLMGEQPKPAQDVYSFAAMVYECLKGEPPFAHGQIEFQIMNKQPEPLDTPSDGPSARGSGTLAASVMAGLAKKPEERPATCAAVLAGRRAAPQGGSTQVGNPQGGSTQVGPQGGRARSPSAPQPGGSRSGATAAILSIVALVILGGAIWYRNTQRQELARERAIAAQQAEAAHQREREEEAKRAEEVARKKAREEQLARQKRAEDERTVKEAEARRMAEESRAKDAVAGIRIEAKVQKGKIGRISAEDGFKQKIEATDDSYIKAEALYDNQRWHEAAVAYSNYVDECKTILSLDGERQQAVAKRSAVQVSFKKAEEAGAKTYARDDWNAAVKIWNAAAAEFGNMEFVAAAETFAKALQEFDACMAEAREKKRAEEEKLAEEKRMAEAREAEQRRREEAARQAEERRRQEERRKAMQSLPGKWRCSTIFHTHGYEGKWQYEYDFLPNGDFRGRLTVSYGASGDTVTTSEGRWTLSGNRLTIHRTGVVTIIPKAYRTTFSSGRHTSEGYTSEHIVLWRNDGSFELRLDNLRSKNDEHVQRNIRHDSAGNEIIHTKMEGGFLRSSVDTSTTETAKIFRRFSN